VENFSTFSGGSTKRVGAHFAIAVKGDKLSPFSLAAGRPVAVRLHYAPVGWARVVVEPMEPMEH